MARATHPSIDEPTLHHLIDVDQRLTIVGRRIRVLKVIGWSPALEDRFLDTWRAGRPELPQPQTQPQQLEAETQALDEMMGTLDRGHPLGNWLYKTAWSYRVAAQMLAHIGQPEFTTCSTLLYGRPDQRYRTQEMTNLDGATEMLDITDRVIDHRRLAPIPYDIPAPAFADMLRARIAGVFHDAGVEVVLDPELSSKAAASSKRIALRSTAMFSERDLDQLAEHEAFIHTLTSLNGRHQPYFPSLGLGSPRTTRTQEGLATFAEIITGAIDIARLRRLALRVVMLKQALDGADFIEVFKGFLEGGQSEVESFRSAARIFRGGDVRGGICFTKDACYLEGVMLVHVFVRKVLQEGRNGLMPLLFAGRVTTGDVLTLAPFLENGLIAGPKYVPPWTRDPHKILALMAFSTATERLRLDFDLDRFAEYEDEVVEEWELGRGTSMPVTRHVAPHLAAPH
jgi:uncharacterized protein (TIGR02421 family)